MLKLAEEHGHTSSPPKVWGYMIYANQWDDEKSAGFLPNTVMKMLGMAAWLIVFLPSKLNMVLSH